ncbi:MAG TPA: ZIP family metal transporter [Candidatus Hydrogenedentes bacterium]|nr:ZIP family metal transporter [Candidatus Hydrogenedentota bacterium]HOL78093.1 ZIP family metal transporter [Candidatus Hydrogenedentota bacterium]HPO86460.1 ZIP family metal transporter [Candidatus Hydrogenedentota bacterium]
MQGFASLHPVLQALLATLFTWGVTALGAGLVFFTKQIDQRVMDGMLGMAAGVMIAASFWSLLAPAIAMSEEMGGSAWVPAVVGFLAGGVFLLATDKLLPHLHPGLATENAEGLKSSWQRATLLVLAITIHNIPEGLAVGVAFGAAASGIAGATLTGAWALAIGIGLQNFPEGAAVSMPLRREGLSRWRSFQYGQISAVVEPIAGVLGAAAVVYLRPMLPYALAFAAGAMIYVVAEELIPEARRKSNSDIPTIGVMVGFAIMMLLDVALG